MTDYLSGWPRPDLFNIRLKLRLPNSTTENFHPGQRFRLNGFFPLIVHKSFEMAFV